MGRVLCRHGIERSQCPPCKAARKKEKEAKLAAQAASKGGGWVPLNAPLQLSVPEDGKAEDGRAGAEAIPSDERQAVGSNQAPSMPTPPGHPLSPEELKTLEAGDSYGLPEELRLAARAIRQGCQALPGGALLHRFSLHRQGQDSWAATCSICGEGVLFADLPEKLRKKAAKKGEPITTGLLQLHLQDSEHIKKAVLPKKEESNFRVVNSRTLGRNESEKEVPVPPEVDFTFESGDDSDED
ncbi:hypothetical protein AB1Y20_007553 [Prymnesium parvum]|uniref:Replication termination factor 2 n=1 Tax=Prymnesium parvum TaxID=97485 RepID=A0AB34IY46_PRYPA